MVRLTMGLVAVLVLAGPAMAQAPGGSASGTRAPPPQLNAQVRNFTLRNLGTKPIEQATARLTNGSSTTITEKGRIMPNASQSFAANNGGCLDSLSVTFAGGAVLHADKLNECHVTQIVVRDDKIDLASSATPGAGRPPQPSNQ